MSTTTPNLTLTLYDSTTDQVVTFATFRAVWGGTATTSNFYRIDTWAGTVNSAITTLQNQRGATLVSSSYVSSNYYEATVASITSYITGMSIILSVDTTSNGTVTLNINGLGTKSLMKVDSTGTPINLTGSDLVDGRQYYFTYDGTRWLWVSANSADQIQIVGTAGNVVTVGSTNNLDGLTTPSSLISSTIHAATAKTSLADSDEFGIADSAASYVLKRITWANIQTAIGTAIGAIINALTSKTTPVGADVISIGDSASSYASKKVLLSNLYKSLGTGTQDSTTYLRGDGTYATVTSGAGVNGWVTMTGVTFTYSSADAPSYVISSNTNLTSVLSLGMKIWFQNNSTDVFGFVTAIGSWSGSAQLITIYCGTDYSVANSAISAPYYSTSKSPLGFPTSPIKWTVKITNTSNNTQNSPTISTWYNTGSISIDIPIGVWNVDYKCSAWVIRNSTSAEQLVTLSTGNSTESDSEFTSWLLNQGATSSALGALNTLFVQKQLLLSSKTTYYLNMKTTQSSVTSISLRGDVTPIVLRAVCGYL